MTSSEWSEVLNPSGTSFILDSRIERGDHARDWSSLEADLMRDARAWEDAWVMNAILSVETGIERRNKELDGMFNELSE
jgi:hypothetical protein